MPNLIHNIEDLLLSRVLKALTPEQCNELLKVLKPTLPKLIKNSSDLSEVLEKLTPEKYKVFKMRQQISAESALNAIQIKNEQLNKGFTRLFFKSISQKKHEILSEIHKKAETIISNENKSANSDQFNEIKQMLEKDKNTLNTHRGFFKFNPTTSDQIADELVNCLERLIVMKK